MTNHLRSILCVVVVFVFSCAFFNDGYSSSAVYGKDWDYGNLSSWGKSSPACDGSRQSPIDINSRKVVSKKLSKQVLYSVPLATNITRKSYSVQLDFTPGSKLMYNGKEYQLLQSHYHADSEHTVDGKHYPLELHLVHQDKDGGLSVIGIFFEKGKKNKAFQEFLNAIPKENKTTAYNKEVSIADLLPKDSAFYAYSGSLTTPGCSETVEWIVMEKPLQVSQEQIEEFLQLRNGSKNNRPVQKVNDRVVIKSSK